MLKKQWKSQNLLTFVLITISIHYSFHASSSPASTQFLPLKSEIATCVGTSTKLQVVKGKRASTGDDYVIDSWKKDGQEIKSKKGEYVFAKHNFELNIKNAKAKHSGVYIAKLEDRKNSRRKIEVKFYVTVPDLQIQRVSPKRVYVIDGKENVLQVQLSEIPGSRISWWFKSVVGRRRKYILLKPGNKNPHYKFASNGVPKENSIRLTNAKYRHSGWYKVKQSLKGCEAEKIIEVQVVDDLLNGNETERDNFFTATWKEFLEEVPSELRNTVGMVLGIILLAFLLIILPCGIGLYYHARHKKIRQELNDLDDEAARIWRPFRRKKKASKKKMIGEVPPFPTKRLS